MNKKEFFTALRQALSALPDEERANVIKYYEDYFLDADGESDEEIIRSLGDPGRIAQDILREYRELQPHPSGQQAAGSAGVAGGAAPRRWKGVNPWVLLLLVVIGVPVCLLIGIPVAGGLLGMIAGLIGIVIGVLALLCCIPAVLVLGGLSLCGLSFLGWGAPASAVLTLGVGLVLLALGGLSVLLLVKLLLLFVPPVFRGIVNLIRWICQKIRGLFR